MDSALMLAFLTDLSAATMFLLVIGVIAVVAIVSGCLTKVLATRAREQTRREIAAYVAEGTIDPDKAVEMIRAARSPDEAFGDLYTAKAEAKAAKADAKADKKAVKAMGSPE